MHNPNLLLLGIGLLAAYGGFDLYRTLKNGRASTWMDGTATRAHQPAKFWRYVYQGSAVVALFIAGFIWIMLLPDWFR